MSHVPLTKLFKKIDNPYGSVDDALKAIGADFEVEKRSVYISDEDDNYRSIPGYASVVRRDTGVPLSIMRSRYGVVQYREALGFLNEIIGNNKAEIYVGEVVDGGAKLHLIVKTLSFIDLGGGEKFEFFFTISTSHDGSSGIQTMCSPIHNLSQTVYTPTGKGVVKLKHSANVTARLALANRIFSNMEAYFHSFGETIKDIVGINLTDQEAQDYFLSVVEGDSTRAQNTRNKLFDLYKSTGLCINLSSCQGTLFGAFMAIQQYADYYKTVRKSIRRSETDARIEARLTGDAAKMKAESFSMALAIVRQFR